VAVGATGATPLKVAVAMPVLQDTVMGVFTDTLPVLAEEVQPPAFFTVKVKVKLVEAAALKLTVIGLLGKATLVAVVKPVPEIE
jgi:hypothetical protein